MAVGQERPAWAVRVGSSDILKRFQSFKMSPQQGRTLARSFGAPLRSVIGESGAVDGLLLRQVGDISHRDPVSGGLDDPPRAVRAEGAAQLDAADACSSNSRAAAQASSRVETPRICAAPPCMAARSVSGQKSPRIKNANFIHMPPVSLISFSDFQTRLLRRRYSCRQGSSTRKRLKPPAHVTSMVPWCWATMPSAMDSPRPKLPFRLRAGSAR